MQFEVRSKFWFIWLASALVQLITVIVYSATEGDPRKTKNTNTFTNVWLIISMQFAINLFVYYLWLKFKNQLFTKLGWATQEIRIGKMETPGD
jgi:hypothetical protein